MNPLDSFTVERLEVLSRGKMLVPAQKDEIKALAKIALAAKRAEPDHIVGVTEKVSDEWIKCSERLPEGKGDVQLFCSDTREQLVGFHKGKGIFQFFSMNDVDGVCEPTHWMPLPAAPKPENK